MVAVMLALPAAAGADVSKHQARKTARRIAKQYRNARYMDDYVVGKCAHRRHQYNCFIRVFSYDGSYCNGIFAIHSAHRWSGPYLENCS